MTTPRDALTKFSEAWNNLRNAVVGRGIGKPDNVPQSLYDRVGAQYERWRADLAKATLADSFFPKEQLTTWVLVYRELADDALAAGLVFEPYPSSLTEALLSVSAAVSKAATPSNVAKVALVLGVLFAIPLALSLVIKRR